MGYRQYTQCVQPQDFSGAPIPAAAAVGLFAGLTALVIGILASGGIGGLLGGSAAGIAIVTGLLSWVHWWLYGRLICLGGDVCAIGMVLSAEPPSEKSVFFARLDSDYSFNLLLPPLLPGASQDDVVTKGIDGNLIAEQPATSSRGLDFKGESARSCNSEKCGEQNCPETAALHCEFEGSGMYTFYQWLKVALGLFIAGAVASTLCLIPVIGTIACLIAGLIIAIAIAATLAGLLIGEFGDAAKPSDVDPSLGGEMHQNGCDGKGADLVVVSGTWVYDSLHEGWNEIHPIKRCHKIGTWDGIWPFDPQMTRDRWCAALGTADSPLTIENQQQPQNQWTIHPFVDGCRPDDDDDDGPIIH